MCVGVKKTDTKSNSVDDDRRENGDEFLFYPSFSYFYFPFFFASLFSSRHRHYVPCAMFLCSHVLNKFFAWIRARSMRFAFCQY